jgi:hypothetical protein
MIEALSILELICQVRYVGPLAKHEQDFREELYEHLRTSGLKRPSRQAILYWFTKKSAPSDRSSKNFLASYVRTLSARPALSHQREKLAEIELLLREADGIQEAKVIRDVGGTHRRADTYVLTMFGMLLEKGWRGDRREDEDFFYCSPFDQPDTYVDESYYIAYRYSTTDKQILKIFVVVKKPIPGTSRQYSFLIFVRGGESEAHATRESQGIILRYDASYYFLGYSYNVADNRDRASDPVAHEKRRAHAKSHPRSLITVAVEYLDIGLDRGLFPALTISTAAQNQPIIARVAVLHLGTRFSLGRQISHEEIDPTQLAPDKIAQDLCNIVTNIQREQTVTFGVSINDIVKQSNFQHSDFEPLATDIMRMIDNTPAVEQRAGDGKSSSEQQRAQGAIETFARRSATRPRP